MSLYHRPQFSRITGCKIDLKNTGIVCSEPVMEKYSFYKEMLKALRGKEKIQIHKRHISDLPEHFLNEININDSNESYGIIISKNSINIYCQSDRTFYYGMIDLVQMIQNDELYEGYIYNYPNMEIRGIIEGFYGKPWSMQDRLDSLKTISQHKMNTYIYAPKNDDYHRSQWYKPYPESELDNIKILFNNSTDNYIDFFYSISPGLSIEYSNGNDFKMLTAKYMQIYELGVRNFAIMLDDIPMKLLSKNDINRFGELIEAHKYIVNRLYEYFKGINSSIRLIVCPTEYFGRGDEEYIVKLGKGIPDDVDIFWTGRAICSQELDTRDAEYFHEETGHKPLYWDNYPVNDAGMVNEMHLGPIIGRDKDLFTFSRGLVSNVMEYKESSIIPVITIAHYLWNSREYDSNASIRSAVKEVAGDADAENLLYFINFCSKSCIKITACEILLSEMTECQYLLINRSPVKAIFKMEKFFKKGLVCGTSLLCMENKKLSEEIRPWVEKYIEFNKLCLAAVNCRRTKLFNRRKYMVMKKNITEEYSAFKANQLEMMNTEIGVIISSLIDA